MKNTNIKKWYFISLVLAITLLLCINSNAFSYIDDEDHDDWLDLSTIDLESFEFESIRDDFVPDEVLAPADSLEHAQAIAAAYGLEFKSYAYGVAVLATTDPEQMVAQSVAVAAAQSTLARVKLPELGLNMFYELHEISENYLYGYENSLYNISNSAEFYSSSHYGEAQWHHEFMDTELAWETTKGENVIIAILDTGIDINHPKFAGRILPNSYNAATNQVGIQYVQDQHARSHGTHVAGIAAASMDGEPSVCGVATNASILSVKVAGYSALFLTL